MEDWWTSNKEIISSGYVRFNKYCCEQGRANSKRCSSSKPKSAPDICKTWCSKPLQVLQDYCDIIKIYIFWPLLFQLEHMNYIDFSKSVHSELNLKKLQQIELLEEIVDLGKKVANDQFFIGGILKIGSKIEDRSPVMDETCNWVKYTGEFKVLHKLEKFGDYCWPMLEIFFTEYKYYITKVALEDCNLVEEFGSQNCDSCTRKGEMMKERGNEEFSQKKYDLAILFYTRAINFCPENHLLYSNRALCFLRIGQYKRALADGKRATILKHNWPKGHYRFCDALSMMGEHEQALEANEKAQKLCRNNPEGMKDLIQQNIKLRKEMEEIKGAKQSKFRMKKSLHEKKLTSDCGSRGPGFCPSHNPKETDNEKRRFISESKDHSCHQKRDIKVAPDVLNSEKQESPSEFPAGHNQKNKGKAKTSSCDSEKTREQLSSKIDSKSNYDKQKSKSLNATQKVALIELTEMLKSLFQDGYTALMDQRYRGAEQAFSQLLNILDPKELKQMNLAITDYLVIIYGYATALLGIGQPEGLSEAENQFKRILEQYSSEGYDCLAYYGIGKVYLRKNKFSDAIYHFEKSKTMIKFIPGVLVWPTTSEIIEESQSERLQSMLENYIEECKFPPEPDAVCSYQNCHGHSKIQIYLTDPDFKGFIRINCCQLCKIEFHISCWKKLKTTFNDKNDKDFLQDPCLTPDCGGIISKIIIFGSTGQIKCEFEHKVVKERDPPRPVVKQKCSSLGKLRIKEDKKSKRKLLKKEAKSLANERMEEKSSDNNSSKHSVHKGCVQSCQVIGDRVLHCIKQNAEKIKFGVQDTSKLLSELLSWWVISKEDYTECSASHLPNETMERLLCHLFQNQNRVKTRIFLHVLSEIEVVVDPKLHEWIQKLNNFGLDATEAFFSRYGDSIRELKCNIITDLWNEKYGHKLDLVLPNSVDGEILECFHLSSLKEARCLIWLLEENREKFPTLHHILDEFFDIMDGPCTILRKQENEDASTVIKVKNKNRKKKQKGSKPVFPLSGVGGIIQDDDIIFTDENPLSFLNSWDPFVVPANLQNEIEEFEALYEKKISNSHHYQRLLDNNPDPKCETLYDYFSQILEEHGPLEITDELLIGEYEHFPEETRKVVEEAGGLKSFLLRSLRFVMFNDFIGLMKDAVVLKEKEDYMFSPYFDEHSSPVKPLLNPAAKEFKPFSHNCSSNVPMSETIKENNQTEKYVDPGHPSAFPFNYSADVRYHGFHINEESMFCLNLLPYSPAHLNFYTAPDYELEKILPVEADRTTVADTARPNNDDEYTDHNAPHFDSEKVKERVLERENISGRMVLSETEISAKLDNCIYRDDNTQLLGNSNAGHYISTNKMKIATKDMTLVRKNPATRMIAVQVNQDLTHQEVNTMPFNPFETQHGDILRMEKEHQVLQEQLREANEKYTQLKHRSSEEIKDLEEQLKELSEKNKISKTELEWMHQDLEKELKKWQQEKKENQEKLKGLKSKIKKFIESNENCLRTVKEKDQQYELHLNKFLEISNKFENEKVKMEEHIKKGKDNYQESNKRSVAAEVSVLKNWKEKELSKLFSRVSEVEKYLKQLKLMNSDSSEVKPEIASWELFLSKIKRIIEETKAQFEDRIQKIQSGSPLVGLSKVQIPDLSTPSSSLRTLVNLPISDPAIVMYSPPIHPKLLPKYPHPEGQSSANLPRPVQTGNQMTTRKVSSPYPASDSSKGKLVQRNYLDPALPTLPSVTTRNPDVQVNHSLIADRLSPSIQKQPPQKPFEAIFRNLAMIFPNYSSSEFLSFIKEVQAKNRGTLSGLTSDEITRRVTDLILDEPSKNKAGKDRAAVFVANDPGRRSSEGSVLVSGTSKTRPVSSKSPSHPPRGQPWVIVGGPTKTKWQKSKEPTTSDEDPCIICHDELNQGVLCKLECGHQFHKQCIDPWLKEQNTCPTCRKHILLPEDFPALSSGRKPT
ncbi:E3 ubiquitin-protein ligase TTC3 isoform X1 [Ornithorhynchus anatinus]|uniref:E3 ubiquitin-protein ligase TTC3 isoform X1 n=1 Tax=Ornithorhynchus anatinus TaxID=9258 RepID=UPI0010A8E086|nr:E3 ubiquitin-protein ligase TTC3 isoform X1 [Ornithorhynchus anatinus]XP_028902373.1 E3 ubiquitin-protein ligase TTC3 isoform X1 [Ornithorhynchus anatinus]XP_039770589.1 E3 ubiquitin-protein ligase TTC3 isoform X1 [Ornithorhynchus anatinus]